MLPSKISVVAGLVKGSRSRRACQNSASIWCAQRRVLPLVCNSGSLLLSSVDGCHYFLSLTFDDPSVPFAAESAQKRRTCCGPACALDPLLARWQSLRGLVFADCMHETTQRPRRLRDSSTASHSKYKLQNVYDTCVLRSTHVRVRAQPRACKFVSRVSIMFYVTALLFFWLKSASTVLRACCQLFVCPCWSDHVVVAWSCWKLPHLPTDRICSLAHACLPIQYLGFRHVRRHHDLSLVSEFAGRVAAERQAPLTVSGQRLPEKALPSSSTLLWASRSECVRT